MAQRYDNVNRPCNEPSSPTYKCIEPRQDYWQRQWLTRVWRNLSIGISMNTIIKAQINNVPPIATICP